MDRRSWLQLLALASIWGASYMFIKIGLRDLSAPMVAWVRIGLASLVLVPVAASQNALGAVRGRLGWVALVGAVQVAGPFLLIGLGEQEISSALAGILVASAPIFTALLAIWVDHEERSEGLRLLGIVIGIAGVVALFGVDLSGSGSAVLGGHRGLRGQAPIRGRAADRRRRRGHGGEHRAPGARGRAHGAQRGSGVGAERSGRDAGHPGYRDRLRDLLHADRPGWSGPLLHRRLPCARVRGGLRRCSAGRAHHGDHHRRAAADPRRLLARGRGLYALASRRSDGATR
jgi:hypothetical protein